MNRWEGPSAADCGTMSMQSTAQPFPQRIVPDVRSADLRLSSPPPLARQLHYLKHTLVFICGADDVAASSTFPSPAVYIREPTWRYKTGQREGGGPEAERGAAEAILRSSGLLARWSSFVCGRFCGGMWRFIGWFSCHFRLIWPTQFVSWVGWWFLGRLFCFVVLEWWKTTECWRISAAAADLLIFIEMHKKNKLRCYYVLCVHPDFFY